MSRVLVTGISTYWGGRLAQAIEQDPSVEAIIGVSPDDPTCELERTEFVRVGLQHALLRRIVARGGDRHGGRRAAGRRLAAGLAAPVAHETNVIGTMNILAACGGPDSPVRKVVFKSSAHYYGCEQDDPAFFTEEMRRPHAPRTRLESDIVEAEKAVDGFAQRNPEVTVTVLRFCNALGPDLRTTHTRLFDLPAVPSILGFDPRYQFIHEDDLVGVLRFAVERDLPGRLQRGRRRRAGAVGGRLAARQAAGADPAAVGQLAGRRGPAPARACGSPSEVLNQLRYGRGLDNRKLKGSRLRVRLHEPRDGAQARRGAARPAAAARGGGAVPLRARGRGVPALEPERAPEGHRVTPDAVAGVL